MSDEAGLPIEPESDPFGYSNAPELKHTALSAKFLVNSQFLKLSITWDLFTRTMRDLTCQQTGWIWRMNRQTSQQELAGEAPRYSPMPYMTRLLTTHGCRCRHRLTPSWTSQVISSLHLLQNTQSRGSEILSFNVGLSLSFQGSESKAGS